MGTTKLELMKATGNIVYEITKTVTIAFVILVSIPAFALLSIVGRLTGHKKCAEDMGRSLDSVNQKVQDATDEIKQEND